MAITNRSANNISDILKKWKQHSSPFGLSYYPRGKVTTAFSKFLRDSLGSPLFDNYYSKNDVRILVDFFAKCPHGYKFMHDYICAHSELKPIII